VSTCAVLLAGTCEAVSFRGMAYGQQGGVSTGRWLWSAWCPRNLFYHLYRRGVMPTTAAFTFAICLMNFHGLPWISKCGVVLIPTMSASMVSDEGIDPVRKWVHIRVIMSKVLTARPILWWRLATVTLLQTYLAYLLPNPSSVSVGGNGQSRHFEGLMRTSRS